MTLSERICLYRTAVHGTMTCRTELRDAIVETIRRNTEHRDVAVACSGGLDSGLVSAIAKEYADSVTLYTCGTANAFDVAMAKDLSEKLDLPWNHVQISKNNITDMIAELAAAGDTDDPFTISYELQLFSVCMAAKEETVLSGQGSDEYFMGCAKFIGASDEDYAVLVEAAKERLNEISIPCELKIAEHFGKKLIYPYLEDSVRTEIDRIDILEMKPADMASRKSVLKEIARDLGYGFLADRTKKSSQYGSGTTDLIRRMAADRNMGYNEFIDSVCGEAFGSKSRMKRGSIVTARIDPILKAKAEEILGKQGLTPSDAVSELYESIVRDDGLRRRRHSIL